MADDNSSTSSDSSDDDFLTTTHPEGGDREALVRRKLLQNFYGRSALGDDDAAAAAGGFSPHRASSGRRSEQQGGAAAVASNADDLDSPAFDPMQHAVKHIQSSSTHELLETEEKLALSVRTLDSTMQTLVYENYSRFTDATDAVRMSLINIWCDCVDFFVSVLRSHLLLSSIHCCCSCRFLCPHRSATSE